MCNHEFVKARIDGAHDSHKAGGNLDGLDLSFTSFLMAYPKFFIMSMDFDKNISD